MNARSRDSVTGTYGLRSIKFWSAYIVQMRPYLLFVSGITGLAGLAFVPEVSGTKLAVLVPIFLGSYGFGQALTDCFQMDTDALSSPYRPLVKGDVSRRDVMFVSLTGLAASGLVLGLHDLRTLPLAGLCIVGLATYTPFKKMWWAGPFYNAWIVVVLFLIGYIAGGGDVRALHRPDFICAVAVVFFGYANFVLTGYYKDISADEATGYTTLPVRFGMGLSAIVSDIFAALASGGTAIGLWIMSDGDLLSRPLAMGFGIAGAAALAFGQLRLHRLKTESEAHTAIEPVVHAYLLLLSAMVVALHPGWAVYLVLGYGAFVLILRKRPMQTQI